MVWCVGRVLGTAQSWLPATLRQVVFTLIAVNCTSLRYRVRHRQTLGLRIMWLSVLGLQMWCVSVTR